MNWPNRSPLFRNQTLERITAGSLGETLAGQLGVSSSYFAAGASRPIIRGLAGARVRIMEDGLDTMDASTISVDHAVSIDPVVAQQIEIFRGPTTLLYGSGAVGGVVNTVTRASPSMRRTMDSKAWSNCGETRWPVLAAGSLAWTAAVRTSPGTSDYSSREAGRIRDPRIRRSGCARGRAR